MSDHEEAITEEEIAGMEVPVNSKTSIKSPKNAFAELMSKKPVNSQSSPAPKTYSKPPLKMTFDGRAGLGAYTAAPEAHDRVIYHNDKAVIIYDMFPKSSVHLLVLPISRKNLEHPFKFFEDSEMLADMKVEVERAKRIVASELRRKYGQFSKSEKARIEARDSDDPPDVLPQGRDWIKEVITGVHAAPSMDHVHIHVLSREMVSDRLKRNNHYNSFQTDFLVPLNKLPLAKDDPIRRLPYEKWYLVDLVCWRCKRNFGNKFAALKRHLEEEMEEWKRE